MTISRDLEANPLSFGSMFWQNQFKTTIPLPPKGGSLQDRISIITGANSGLGFECAKQMLGAGLSRLILGVRSIERGNVAAAELHSINPEAEIDVWHLDMEDYNSVQKFTSRCEAEIRHIDLVILNAGLAATEFTRSKTGHEMDIQVNYLSTILLTILLLPILKSKKRDSGRVPYITIVSSATTRNVKFLNQDRRPLLSSFDDIETTPWSAPDRYGVSKLLVQLFVERMAEQYIDPNDTVINLVEPGWVKQTGLNKNLNLVLRTIVNGILYVAGRPVDQGAATYYDAVVNQGSCSHGSYIMNCKPAPYGDFAYSEKAQSLTDLLWDETLAELDFAQTLDILTSVKRQDV